MLVNTYLGTQLWECGERNVLSEEPEKGKHAGALIVEKGIDCPQRTVDSTHVLL